MRPALIPALALLALLPIALAEPAQTPKLPHTEQLAKQLIVQRVFFPNASIEEWVAVLNKRSREADPTSRGLNIRTLNEQVAATPVHDLSLRHASFHHVLTSVAEHSGTVVEFGEDSIIFKPASPLPPEPEAPAKAAPTATAAKALEFIIPSVDFEGTTLEEARDFLWSRASELDPEIDPNKRSINLRIPTEELAKRQIHELKLRNVTLHYAATAIAEHTGTTVEFGEESIVFRPANPKAVAIPPASFAETLEIKDAQTDELIATINPDAATPIKIGGREVIIARKEISYLERKARDITIPVLDFGDSTLAEVCDFLRSRCRELDFELDPNKKGINVRIPTKELAEKTVHELKLCNVTLHHALTATAEAIGATVEFSNECIVFKPADPKAPVVHAKPDKNAVMAIKARMINLPVLDFKKTRLSEAMDFLRARSRELDWELDPGRKGVNIRIVDALLAENEIHELKLHNVTLHHALTIIARMTGTSVEFGDESIVFRPAPRADRQDHNLPLLPPR